MTVHRQFDRGQMMSLLFGGWICSPPLTASKILCFIFWRVYLQTVLPLNFLTKQIHAIFKMFCWSVGYHVIVMCKLETGFTSCKLPLVSARCTNIWLWASRFFKQNTERIVKRGELDWKDKLDQLKVTRNSFVTEVAQYSESEITF